MSLFSVCIVLLALLLIGFDRVCKNKFQVEDFQAAVAIIVNRG